MSSGRVEKLEGMETIKIRDATADDAAKIADIHYNAINQRLHVFYDAFFARNPRDILPLSTAAALKDPAQIFLVAENTSSGEMMGFIRYYMEHDVVEEGKPTTSVGEAVDNQTNPVPSLFAPKEHLKALWTRFSAREDEIDTCYMDEAKGQKHIYVKHLMVYPRYQRQGVGKSLLAAVVAKSDSERVPTFIVASAEAYNLYLKLGFEEYGTFKIDNVYWAKEIVQYEREHGIQGNERLAEHLEGLEETERCMVRWLK